MRHDIELQAQVQQHADITPQWYPLDIGNGNTLTLDYVSNLLSDVSQINSSRSFTVKLPRTRRNDAAFDLAVVPQHESQRPYRYLPCRIFVDGIDVVGNAFMYLVSSEAATYNAVIVFGLMQEYKAWVDAGKGLKELQDSGQSVIWNWRAAYIFTPLPGSVHDIYDYPPIWFGDDANVNTYTPANGLGRLMYYGIYNPGFERSDTLVDYANVHPFVTMREIWERIISENSLNFILPSSVLLDMENLAIVLTSIKGNTPNGIPENHTLETDGEIGSLGQIGNYYYFRPNFAEDGYIEEGGSMSYKVKSRGDGPVRLTFHMKLTGQSVEWAMARLGNDTSKIRLLSTDLVAGTTSYIEPLYFFDNYEQEWILQYFGILDFVGSDEDGVDIAALQFRVPKMFGGFDNFYNYFSNMRVSNAAGNPQFPQPQKEVVGVTWYSGTYDYPNKEFRLFPNLPDIKQVDFVKMVCHLYGLFPCQRGNAVYFVPIEDLEENKIYAYDWSDYLLEDDPDAPHHTDWHMTDLARRNRVSYKEDDKDLVVDEAFLTVDDDTLDREKDFFIIPLAASDGDTINQYSITPVYDDSTDPPTLTGYKAEFTECEHRLMRVVEWYNGEKNVTRLAFQNLSSAQIIAERYGAYQSYVNQPRIVTERLRVPLADLQTLDYSKPVFLSKYGKYFAIIDIKWTVTQDTCEAKFLML